MTLDEEDVEAIAQRVAELLRAPVRSTAAVRLVDAQAVADTIGVDREWVYAHSAQLGAIRLGGKQGRLRFDLKHVQQALTTPKPKPMPDRSKPGRRRPRRWPRNGVDLLPYES